MKRRKAAVMHRTLFDAASEPTIAGRRILVVADPTRDLRSGRPLTIRKSK